MTEYAYQSTVKHIHPVNIWTLTLNRYQRDNLLWLLNCCGYGRDAIQPFHLANTGDWNGELVNMLGKTLSPGEPYPKYATCIDELDRPNKSFEQLALEVDRWKNASQ